MKNKTPKNIKLVSIDGSFVYDESVVFALFLVENADKIFYRWGEDTFWKYCSEDGCFYYSKPNNEKRKGWYKGRGLQCSYNAYIRRNKPKQFDKKIAENLDCFVDFSEPDMPF